MIKIKMLFWAITIHHIITVLHQESSKSQTIGKNDISKSIYFHVLSSQWNLSRNLKKKLQLSISNLTEPGLGIVASSVGFEHNILHMVRAVAGTVIIIVNVIFIGIVALGAMFFTNTHVLCQNVHINVIWCNVT